MELKAHLIEIVRVFREAFQLKQDDAFLHDQLFAEEHAEYHKALTENNLVEKADALADMVFVSSGGIIEGFTVFNGARLNNVIFTAKNEGIDLLRATQTVFTSNMSKLAALDSIASTRDKYAKLGVEVEFQAVDELDHTAGFRVICSRTVIGADSKEYPAGKLLKSTDYKEPDWSYLSGVK